MSDHAPQHPAAPFGHHARKLFEDVVENTALRKRKTKSSERLVNEGLLYDRYVGVDEHGFDIFEFSARIEAYEEYCAWLDAEDAKTTPSSP